MAVKGKTFDGEAQSVFVVKRLLDVSLETIVGLLETFATGLASQCGEHVLSIFGTGRKGEFYLEILHVCMMRYGVCCVKFGCKITKNREKPTLS
jgi:hypothetical protein